MTLATRCPHCGTVFRVVPDQLRVSQGWVRCGRCSEAFNALETMVDWPPRAAAPAPGPGPTPVPTPASTAAPMVPPAAEDDRSAPESEFPRTLPPDTDLDDAAPPRHGPPPGAPPPLFTPGPGEFVVSDAPVPMPAGPERTEPSFGFDRATDAAPDAAWPEAAPLGTAPARSEATEPSPDMPAGLGEPQAAAAETAPASEAVTALASSVDVPAVATPDLERPPAPKDTLRSEATPGAAPVVEPESAPPEPTPEAPSFVRKANRAERWRRPGVRAALASAAAILTLALAGQATYAFRDRIAAASPTTLKPWLQQACATLGCRVGEFRQIESLSVESSALVKVESAPVYRLSVTLRNRADLEVAAPALDLALTDAQGRPIARRVLQMSDLGLPLRSLKPNSELPIQATLGIGERPVSGYTVEIFYP